MTFIYKSHQCYSNSQYKRQRILKLYPQETHSNPNGRYCVYCFYFTHWFWNDLKYCVPPKMLSLLWNHGEIVKWMPWSLFNLYVNFFFLHSEKHFIFTVKYLLTMVNILFPTGNHANVGFGMSTHSQWFSWVLVSVYLEVLCLSPWSFKRDMVLCVRKGLPISWSEGFGCDVGDIIIPLRYNNVLCVLWITVEW